MTRWVDLEHTCGLCAPKGVPLRPGDVKPIRGRCNAERWPNIDEGNDDGPNHFVGLCRKYPIAGGTVCPTHGGSAPQVKAAAARKLQMDAAQAAVLTYGLPIDISPTEALLAEVQWTAGHVAWLRLKVQELTETALTWGTVKRESEGIVALKVDTDGDDVDLDLQPAIGTKRIEAAGPPVLVELYDRERKHLVAVAAAALKAGVEERKVRLAEQQGDLVAQLLRDLAGDLNLTPEQEAVFAEAAPRRLRLIAGGAA